MTTNLLINPGAEGLTRPGGYTHLTHTGEAHGNFVTPEGWVGYWDETGARRRPETKVIERVPPFVGPPCRIDTGDWAYLMFISFYPWIGGLYQIVDGLEIGKQYAAGFSAHAWVGNPHLPNFGKADCAPMGCGPLYRLESQLPPLSGDPVRDAWHAALFQVGVQFLEPGQAPDPTYGVNWGHAAAIYNAYAAVPELVFTAETRSLAVFTKGAFLFGMRNNDGYFDSAYLIPVEETPVRPYERTYVLLPPDVTRVEAQMVLDDHFDARQTIGFSADDAGVDAPNLTERNVIAYRPEGWPSDLKGFFDTHYPGLDSYEARPLGEEPPPPPPPPHDLLLAQRHPDWINAQFGSGSCNFTIGQQGCFITCLAMAQRFYGIQDDATPVTVDEALGQDGYNSCTANWRGRPQLYEDVLGLGVRLGSREQAVVHMLEGGCAFAEMLPEAIEHFVLVYEGVDWMALDPWANVERVFKLSEAQSWRILTHVGPQPPPVVDRVNRISGHFQTMIPGIESFLQTARPASVKRVTGMEDLKWMKQRAPWIKTVYRHDGNPEGSLQFCDPGGQVTSESLRCAGDWLARYSDSLITVSTCGLWSRSDPFYMEGPNEFGWAAGDRDKIKRAASLERSWLIKLAELNIPVAPITFCAGVGNIGRPGQEEWDFLMLLDLAKETAAMGGGFGLHHYWTPYKLVEGWKYLGGRYQWIDRVLEENGVRGLLWFLGEGGVCGVVGNPSPTSRPGWRSPDSYDGDWDLYLADILEANRRHQLWNSTHGNRCVVLNLFTSGIGDLNWDTFLLKTEELNALAVALS